MSCSVGDAQDSSSSETLIMSGSAFPLSIEGDGIGTESGRPGETAAYRCLVGCYVQNKK